MKTDEQIDDRARLVVLAMMDGGLVDWAAKEADYPSRVWATARQIATEAAEEAAYADADYAARRELAQAV